MALTTDTPPLDPGILTGPARVSSGIVSRIGTATPGTPYGEYATYLYVGTTGNVSIQTWNGSTIVLTALTTGQWHKIASTMVNTSGTAATGILWGS